MFTPLYGLRTHFERPTSPTANSIALNTFSDLVAEAREQAQRDAAAAGMPDDGVPLRDGGTGATAYGRR